MYQSAVDNLYVRIQVNFHQPDGLIEEFDNNYLVK